MLNNNCLTKISRMIKKIFLKVALVVTIVLVSGINVFKTQMSIELSDIAMANVEALAQSENGSMDCNYRREEGTCTINVGSHGSIKLLSGTILKADAQGYITFDGKVSCESGGSSSCRNIECVDIYKMIF